MSKINETYLSIHDHSSFKNISSDISIFFTDIKPDYMINDSYICDDCVYKLLYDGTLQFDYKLPWYMYKEPPTENEYLGSLDLSKYKSPPYDYKKRLFRNATNYDYTYPYIYKTNMKEIKLNPNLFGEYSRKIAKSL